MWDESGQWVDDIAYVENTKEWGEPQYSQEPVTYTSNISLHDIVFGCNYPECKNEAVYFAMRYSGKYCELHKTCL